MTDVTLTPTSYLVLGLVGHAGEATSYQMKRSVARSIGYFWSFPHSQLYAEPARLVQAGLLRERQERTGRRRRTYALTAAGGTALAAWLREPTGDQTEIRDLALLKLFFGRQATVESVVALAEAAAEAHRAQLAEYESFARVTGPGVDAHRRLTLELGLRYERAALRFWQEVAADPPTAGDQPTRPAPTRASQ
jgi:DNA-binding PadR family transcriptional regulator